MINRYCPICEKTFQCTGDCPYLHNVKRKERENPKGCCCQECFKKYYDNPNCRATKDANDEINARLKLCYTWSVS